MYSHVILLIILTECILDADKARSEFEKAERSLRDIERELRHLQEGLEKDFGPEDEFGALDGECYQYTDREYTYKLCPFDQVISFHTTLH